MPALCTLAAAGLEAVTLWHTKMSKAGIEGLMKETGMVLDTSMASSDGTYLLRRRER